MKYPKAVEKIENGDRLSSPRQNFWFFQNGPLDPSVAEGPFYKQFLFGMGRLHTPASVGTRSFR